MFQEIISDRKMDTNLILLKRQVTNDYGYTEDEIDVALHKVEVGGSHLLEKVLTASASSSDLLGLVVHSLSTVSTDEDSSFSMEDRVQAILATHASSREGSSSNEILGIKWTVIIEIPMLQKFGRATFTEDATFSVVRTALAEFLASSPASPRGACSLIDDGTLLISILDENGWSKELAQGTFAAISARIALDCKSLPRSPSSNPSVPKHPNPNDHPACHTLTLRSTRDPIGPRQRISELKLLTRHNKSMMRKVSQLEPLGYCGWRAIRGDGNCYYRAVMTGFFELVLEEGDDGYTRTRTDSLIPFILDILTSIQPSILSIYGAGPAAIHLTLFSILVDTKTWAAFEATLLSSSELDLAVVRVARCLVGLYLVTNQNLNFNGISIKDSILACWDDVASVEDYTAKYVYPLGVDAEGTLADLGVLFRALRCKGVTVLVNGRESSAEENFVESESTSAIETPAAGSTQSTSLSDKEEPLRVYESGGVSSDIHTARHDDSALGWIASIFTPFSMGMESSFETVREDMHLTLPTAVVELGTIHLMLRAGNGMGEGHYDLLYAGTTIENKAGMKVGLMSKFRYGGHKRALMSSLPVPPLIVPNHVHVVKISVEKESSGSGNCASGCVADPPAVSSITTTHSQNSHIAPTGTPHIGTSHTGIDMSSDSDSDDTLDHLGWEDVEEDEESINRKLNSLTAVTATGSNAHSNVAVPKKKKKMFSLRVTAEGESTTQKKTRESSPRWSLLSKFSCFKL